MLAVGEDGLLPAAHGLHVEIEDAKRYVGPHSVHIMPLHNT
jgi:hypothetical protein